MRRLIFGAALVVLIVAGLTLTNGSTTGRVETTKRSADSPAARPADADQLWAANPTETGNDGEGDVAFEITVASDGSEDDGAASGAVASGGVETETTLAFEVVDAATTESDATSTEVEAEAAEETEAAPSEDSTPTDDETADSGSIEASGDDDEAVNDGLADADASSFATDDDAETAATEPAEAVSSATTTSAARGTTTTQTPATTAAPRPTTSEVDDPTAALANAIHSDRVTTSTSRAPVAASKNQPFLTVYGPDGLPQLQPLPSDPYAPTPDIRLGSISIPAIGLDHSLHQGMTLTALDRGPSQWPGSAMPGQVGNMVIGGHRTTRTRPFRNLDDLNKGDEVIVTDEAGVDHTYEVLVVEIVTPDAIHIATQTEDATATLFACHPPGSARQRIVVKLALA